MMRIASRAAWVAVGASVALGVAAGADRVRTPSTLAIMHRQYTVTKAPFKAIEAELDSESPDWDKLRASAEKFAGLAEGLVKNEPKWGTRASWEVFTGKNVSDAKALAAAAEARDLAEALALRRRLAASCKACHDAHRFGGDEAEGN